MEPETLEKIAGGLLLATSVGLLLRLAGMKIMESSYAMDREREGMQETLYRWRKFQVPEMGESFAIAQTDLATEFPDGRVHPHQVPEYFRPNKEYDLEEIFSDLSVTGEKAYLILEESFNAKKAELEAQC
ncbi:hypothetical protein ACFL1B_04365 [Nanoarchaeota archaeon]